MMGILPTVIDKGFRNYCSADYLADRCPDFTDSFSVRHRFNELSGLITSLNAASKSEIESGSFNHFLIKAAVINDARIACLAIYRKLLERYGISGTAARTNAHDNFDFDDLEDDICYDPSSSDLYGMIFEKKDAEADIRNPWIIEYHDKQISKAELAIKANAHVMFLLCGTDKCSAEQAAQFDSLAGFMDFHSVYISDSKEPVGTYAEMLEEYFASRGFDTGSIRSQIELIASDPRIDEYSFKVVAAEIIKEHFLRCDAADIISADAFSKAKDRFLAAGRKAAHTSVKSSAPAVKAAKQQKLVGLESEQKKLGSIINMMRLQRDRNISDFGCNLLFTGSPGTAKTTLAREFAAALENLGFISSACNFKECRKSDFIAKYTGQTAHLVDDLFSEMAYMGGGVLFFDEIYTLSEEDSTCYDKEAIACMIQNMENYRSEVYCIFAGYPGKMETFLSSNPGMRSRIQFSIAFRDYDTATLNSIFLSFAKKDFYKLPADYSDYTSGFFDELRRRRKSEFGNGREARNLYENCLMEHADRIYSSRRKVSKAAVSFISAGDITRAAENILSSECGRNVQDELRKVGFI